MKDIVFGAGCFWGVQYFFDSLKGVVETQVGYAGGTTQSPTYQEVCRGTTGHAEVCRVTYDDTVITTESVINQFFMMHDPTQRNRQGPDIGSQYRSIILVTSTGQHTIAEGIKNFLISQQNLPIATVIEALGTFWPAEEYHQKYTERTGHGACHVMPHSSMRK